MQDADAALAERLGKRVRRRRDELGWSQAELAERIGTSVEYVSMLERGARLPSVPTLVSLGQALVVGVDSLLEHAEPARANDDRLTVLTRAVPHELRSVVARMIAGLVDTNDAQPVRPRAREKRR